MQGTHGVHIAWTCGNLLVLWLWHKQIALCHRLPCYASHNAVIQMNGAELPCGTVIQVQPASSDYKKSSHSHYGNGESEEGKSTDPRETKGKTDVERVEEATADLDDFFASLT
mmetsp:Transcript_6323/g.14280  ORF Transcript_6323/g.14280 Transcript_6323/m.14280 type:complete len:113 (-) Transcript_6323:144-482(-)